MHILEVNAYAYLTDILHLNVLDSDVILNSCYIYLVLYMFINFFLDQYPVKGLLAMGMFRGGSSPVSRSEFEKILTTLTSIITAESAKTVKWELALKALVCMGSFIDQYRESEKAMSYMGIVVENLVSLVRSSQCSLPYPLILEATSEVCSTRPKYVEKMVQGFEEAFCSSFSDFYASLGPMTLDRKVFIIF